MQPQWIDPVTDLAEAGAPGPQRGQGEPPGQRPGLVTAQMLGLLHRQRAQGESHPGDVQDHQVDGVQAGPRL
ncbi:MAG TPA: hypothetical protein VHN80_02065 [Kineosporiaceae bacterium]|nr:hypothetical protein [Kineosporiaceae bacterium]